MYRPTMNHKPYTCADCGYNVEDHEEWTLRCPVVGTAFFGTTIQLNIIGQDIGNKDTSLIETTVLK